MATFDLLRASMVDEELNICIRCRADPKETFGVIIYQEQ